MDIFYCAILLACLHTKGTCHVRFTASGYTGNINVAVVRNVFTCGKSSNKSFVEFLFGSIINCSYPAVLTQHSLSNDLGSE